MESLERALKATRLVFEENSAGDRHEATMNPFGSEKPRRTLNRVLNIPKANLRSGDLLDLVRDLTDATNDILERQQNNRHAFKFLWYRDLKDATNDILERQQNNRHAFKFLWYRHIAKEQWTVPSSVGVRLISNVEGRVWKALESVLDAFRFQPFAVSPEQTNRLYNLPTFAILTHNHETATRHGELARQIGKAWVDDHLLLRYIPWVQKLDFLQTSLFELLWSGTVGQLKQHNPHSSDDPERPEFERAVKELESVLQEAIVRSKKPHFSIALCGMVKAGKSLFLNALMGKSILSSEGESVNSRIPYPILSITADLPSTAWPCRIRHVEGQTVPKLQFQAKPFISALKKLRAHQYGRKVQTYPSPAEIYDTPSVPSDEEILLRMIHRQWGDLHTVTRNNLLKFETPGFTLPPMARGEHDVKILVSFVSC